MNEIQNKAWNLLTEKEKQALTLGLGYAKSSWEVGEMMGLSHYKFLELKERAERFFKLFEGYFSKYPSLVRPNSLDDRFRDFIEGIIEKRKGDLNQDYDSSLYFIIGTIAAFCATVFFVLSVNAI